MLNFFRNKIRNTFNLKQISLAKKFEQLIRGDDTFEIVGDVLMGLVCFRLKVYKKVELKRFIDESHTFTNIKRARMS